MDYSNSASWPAPFALNSPVRAAQLPNSDTTTRNAGGGRLLRENRTPAAERQYVLVMFYSKSLRYAASSSNSPSSHFNPSAPLAPNASAASPRMVATPLLARRSARSFPNSTISRGPSSAGSTMPPLRRSYLFPSSPFGRRLANDRQSHTSTLFGMRRSYGAKRFERLRETARPDAQRRGKAI